MFSTHKYDLIIHKTKIKHDYLNWCNKAVLVFNAQEKCGAQKSVMHHGSMDSLL